MGDATETIRPIWRTPLAAALAGWMTIVLGATLMSGRLMEIVPGESLLILALAVYVAPVPILLGWSFWAMLREPMTAWLAPTILLAFCGGFAPAIQPLRDMAAALNFAAHRPTYDAIAEEAARIRARGGPDGFVSGSRNGVAYRYRAERPGEIDFPWTRNAAFTEGIRFDDTPCVARAGRICTDTGRRLDGYYSHYRIGF
jgi:hypothetical protein